MNGLCGCGCGQVTTIATRDRPGCRRGEHARFVHGHAARVLTGPASSNWKGDQASYSAIHNWLRIHYPKAGACEFCHAITPTDYALIHGRPYSRNRLDYYELCRTCHNRYDNHWRTREAA